MQKQRVKNSVKASIKDGIAWAAMSGFAEPYAVPFAMALGASTMGVGVLRSIPSLASSDLHLPGGPLFQRIFVTTQVYSVIPASRRRGSIKETGIHGFLPTTRRNDIGS